MAQTNPMEVPPELRSFVVQNIEQAREACKQLIEATNKFQEMVSSMVPGNPALEGLSDVTERTMRFTHQNLDAGFSLAHELAKAKDLTEMLHIQNRYAQLQMHAYALQAQELGALVSSALQRVGRSR